MLRACCHEMKVLRTVLTGHEDQICQSYIINNSVCLPHCIYNNAYCNPESVVAIYLASQAWQDTLIIEFTQTSPESLMESQQQ